MLQTRLTELLGCRYPVVQTAMGWVADPKLVAATGNAGGFGFLAGATIPAEQMERDILRTKELTQQPFGVNFHMYQPNAADIVGLVVKHGVRAVSYSRSPGKEFIRKLKDAGVVCMPTVGAVKHAVKAVELGADVVTVQGGEGGGHTGSVPTTLLLPEVVRSVKVPVVAAGGFKDGRGLVAAMAWGAEGIAMGTRFLMTADSPVPAGHQGTLPRLQEPGGHHRLDRDGRHAAAHGHERDSRRARARRPAEEAADRAAQRAGLPQAQRCDDFRAAEVRDRDAARGRPDARAGDHVGQRADDHPARDGRGQTRAKACCRAARSPA